MMISINERDAVDTLEKMTENSEFSDLVELCRLANVGLSENAAKAVILRIMIMRKCC